MLTGRKIFVAGGSEGIGFASAKLAVGYGAKVTIMGRSQKKLDQAQAEIGEGCFAVQGDATSPEDVKRAIEFAIEKMGGMDGALNNVGATRNALITEITDEQFDWTVKTTLYSCMYCMREEARYFKANGIPASIVNMSSLNGEVTYKQYGPYAAAKGGVNMLTKTAALELAEDGIRVNAVAPGFIATPMNQPIIDYKPLYDAVLEHLPMKRMAQPSEIGELVCWLLSERASFVTGEIMTVDGGMQNCAYPDIYPVILRKIAEGKAARRD